MQYHPSLAVSSAVFRGASEGLSTSLSDSRPKKNGQHWGRGRVGIPKVEPAVVQAVVKAVQAEYGLPRHGNPRRPLDDPHIIVSREYLSTRLQRLRRAMELASRLPGSSISAPMVAASHASAVLTTPEVPKRFSWLFRPISELRLSVHRLPSTPACYDLIE